MDKYIKIQHNVNRKMNTRTRDVKIVVSESCLREDGPMRNKTASMSELYKKCDNFTASQRTAASILSMSYSQVMG